MGLDETPIMVRPAAIAKILEAASMLAEDDLGPFHAQLAIMFAVAFEYSLLAAELPSDGLDEVRESLLQAGRETAGEMWADFLARAKKHRS